MNTIKINNRMNNKIFSERNIISVIYLVIMIIYMTMQVIFEVKKKDHIFPILLFVATFFLCKRQEYLYKMINDSEESKEFYKELYHNDSEKMQKKHTKKIFSYWICDMFAVLYALIFGAVIWLFNIWQYNVLIKCIFTIMLIIANYATGLGIIRLLLYFYFSHKWCEKIIFHVFIEENSTIFMRKVRNIVLFTLVCYSSTSLSGIIFTSIQVNLIVILYTIFAIILIISVFIITEIEMNKIENKEYTKIYKILSVNINQEYWKIIDSYKKDNNKKINIENLESLLKLKDILNNQQNNKYKIINKIKSNVLLIIIAIIPILLQYFLGLLK